MARAFYNSASIQRTTLGGLQWMVVCNGNLYSPFAFCAHGLASLLDSEHVFFVIKKPKLIKSYL